MHTKFLTLLFIVLFALTLSPAIAADKPTMPNAADQVRPITPAPTAMRPTAPTKAPEAMRGSLPDNRVTRLPQPEESDITEANNVGKICEGSAEKDFFDCDCVALNYLQQLTSSKATTRSPNKMEMKDNAKRACTNQPAIAGRNYKSCLNWAPKMRQDYESFCSCYGNAYAAKFAEKPAITILENRAVMSSAMKTCEAGKPVKDRMTRNARIEEMKKQGTYNEMFPTAKDNHSNPASRPQPADPTPSQLQPWQKLQRTLLDPNAQR